MMPDLTYTVVGFYSDNMQPWIEFVMAKSPSEAAEKAVQELIETNGGDLVGEIMVVEILPGHLLGCLGNEKCLTGTRVLNLA